MAHGASPAQVPPLAKLQGGSPSIVSKWSQDSFLQHASPQASNDGSGQPGPLMLKPQRLPPIISTFAVFVSCLHCARFGGGGAFLLFVGSTFLSSWPIASMSIFMVHALALNDPSTQETKLISAQFPPAVTCG